MKFVLCKTLFTRPRAEKRVSDTKKKEARILLTGFEVLFLINLEPFGPHEINPSYEALLPLSNAPLTSPNCVLYPVLLRLPVHYMHTNFVLPTLHQYFHPKPDIYLHVGVGAPGGVKLETCARSYGYNGLDNAGERPPNGMVPGQDKKTLQGTTKTEAMAQTLQNEGWKDAGQYLCEWVFFHSLAEQQNNTVQFVHVPPVGQPYSLEQLTQILKRIIILLANDL